MMKRMLLVGALVLALGGCTKTQATTATGIGVTVATDVCKELETQPEPDWVLLACTVEQTAAVASVILALPSEK